MHKQNRTYILHSNLSRPVLPYLIWIRLGRCFLWMGGFFGRSSITPYIGYPTAHFAWCCTCSNLWKQKKSIKLIFSNFCCINIVKIHFEIIKTNDVFIIYLLRIYFDSFWIVILAKSIHKYKFLYMLYFCRYIFSLLLFVCFFLLLADDDLKIIEIY